MFHMQNIVGRKIRLARQRFQPRLTQAALSAKLQLDGWNIDRAGVGKIETGLRQVTDVELLKLAKALEITIAWLFDQEEK